MLGIVGYTCREMHIGNNFADTAGIRNHNFGYFYPGTI
jgi:hypothetical protein